MLKTCIKIQFYRSYLTWQSVLSHIYYYFIYPIRYLEITFLLGRKKMSMNLTSLKHGDIGGTHICDSFRTGKHKKKI